MEFWHGSELPRKKLTAGYDGGVHLGTREQAEMRNSAFLHRVSFLGDMTRVRRSKDEGLDWRSKIRSARTAGFDGIVYLNRYEGMSDDGIRALAAHPDPDRMSDKEFRRLVPDAADSFISLDESSVIVREVVPGAGRVKMYHGTSRENAQHLIGNGFDPGAWRAGPNSGRRGLLYLTDDEENARWFAEQHGDGVVLEMSVRACDLIVDPEDGVGNTVVEEMLLETPACLATSKPIPAHLVRMCRSPEPGPVIDGP